MYFILTLINQGPLETGENSKTPPGSSFSTMTISWLVKPGFRIWFSAFVLNDRRMQVLFVRIEIQNRIFFIEVVCVCVCKRPSLKHACQMLL